MNVTTHRYNDVPIPARCKRLALVSRKIEPRNSTKLDMILQLYDARKDCLHLYIFCDDYRWFDEWCDAPIVSRNAAKELHRKGQAKAKRHSKRQQYVNRGNRQAARR